MSGPRSRRAASVLLATSALLLGALGQAAVAAGPSAPGGTGNTVPDFLRGPAKGTGAAASAAPAHVSGCSLHGNAGSVHDEWLSCLSVQASLSHAPALGQTAALRISVTADAALPGTSIDVQLPSGLEWVQRPAGLQPRVLRSARPEDRGSLASAFGRRDLRKGQVLHFSGTVRSVHSGPAQIRVRAVAPHAGGTQAGDDAVFLTVGPAGAASRLGIRSTAKGATAVRAVHGAAVASTSRPSRSVGTAGLAKVPAGARAGSPCDTRVTGNWGYRDQVGAWHNSPNFQVQVWDDDIFSDTLLASGITDGSGNYNLCFNSQSEGFPDGGTADVYVRFVSENSIWRVQRGGSAMTFTTGTTNDVATGSTLNLGSLTSGDAALQRGLHAFDEANDAWQFVPKPRNLCFDQNDSSCRQLRINWAPDSTDGTYYSLGGNDVHLAADDPNAHTTVVHEISHAIMDDVYNDAFPPAPSCSPHSIEGTSSAGCAWTEGFAEWLPATIYHDPFFRWPNGASLDLENASWGNGWGEGDTTEGRIAGALIDITDSANEGPWDRYGESWGGIWFTFTHHVSNTLGQFWAQRAADGFNVSDAGALADLYQNTVDYGLRDPLTPYVPLTRPNPVPPHNYGFGTTSSYWSAVAIRPAAGVDHDLTLYDDRGLTSVLGGSGYGSGVIDFVAIDSNRRALGDYYPRVNRFSGSGAYQIELAQGSQSLSPGSAPVVMGGNDVVAVRDTYLYAGQRATFRVTPSNSGQDAEAFLLSSDPANASTWVRSRGAAVAGASAAGPGGAEQFSYTPAASGWYGLVVLNKQGSGTYTVIRDDSRPTGSVLVNGGALRTHRRAVSLALPASDPQSGVTAMRISTDGVLDTEAWTSYAASRVVSLPGGNGTKNVRAQFRNGVGLVSPVVSDSIVLSLPDLRVRSASNGSLASRGSTLRVTDTTVNTGTWTAAASQTRYYLSADSTLGRGDRLLGGGRAVPVLGAGISSSGSRLVVVPSTTPVGWYHVIARADATGLVQEAYEVNNTAVSAVPVRVR